ncbi:acylphosphatase [Rothia sp. P100]|uniref:acylphosphatase n=1 Tax=Rothia sp. P100 TaxID=2939578 RepID=UPI00204171AD|nr:acylphosphatase [Rothia sp. P100]MCM3510038.1 acylphosphatase [Rothia sp. P100]
MGFFDFLSDSRAPKQTAEPAEAQLTATVHGRVQGVGFRWWVASKVKPLGLVGYAKNLDDGTVEIIAQGRRADCESLLAALKSGDTAGHVEQVQAEMGEPEGRYKSFGIY